MDWLYFKIYLEPSFVDGFMVMLYELIQELLAKKKLKSWFFVRYHDEIADGTSGAPDEGCLNSALNHFHVRLRICPQVGHSSYVMRRIKTLISLFATRYSRLIKWTLDTYIAETDRYGGVLGMECAHRIFQFNSEDVCGLLATPMTAKRDAFVTLGEELLLCLGLSISERRDIYVRRLEWMIKNFPIEPSDIDRLDLFYQKKSRHISPSLHRAPPTSPGECQFVQNITYAVECGRELFTAATDNKLLCSPHDICAAIHHMHCNRAGFTPAVELAVLYYLARWLAEAGK